MPATKYANPVAQMNIRRSQIKKLQNRFPAVWSRTSKTGPLEEAFLLRERGKEVCKLRRVDLSLDIDFIESFVAFYQDGTAEIILVSEVRGTQKREVEIRRSQQLSESPFRIEEEYVPYIFFDEGLSITAEGKKEASYREIFRLLSDYLRWLDEQ